LAVYAPALSISCLKKLKKQICEAKRKQGKKKQLQSLITKNKLL